MLLLLVRLSDKKEKEKALECVNKLVPWMKTPGPLSDRSTNVRAKSERATGGDEQRRDEQRRRASVMTAWWSQPSCSTVTKRTFAAPCRLGAAATAGGTTDSVCGADSFPILVSGFG